LKRLKEFYEVEHPQTKQGAKGGNFKEKPNESTTGKTPVVDSFAKATAEKINKSDLLNRW
jgi:hypothetical protein